MKSKKMLGNVLLTVTAIIWGTAFVGQRVGMESIEPFTFGGARMVFAAISVGIVAFIMDVMERKKPQTRTPEEQKAYAKNTWIGGICCGICLMAAASFQQLGMVYTSAGKAGFITAMYMLLVPIVNFLLFKKRNTWLVWLAVLVGVCGMYLLCMTEGFTLTKGDTLVSICAFCFCFHILCCDHFVQLGNPIKISCLQFATVAVLSWICAFLTETPTISGITQAAIPILYCGIMSAGVGYTLQIVAQKFTDPTIASLLMSLESVFAVIAGAILLNEKMSSRELLGCIIMFVAIVMVQIPLPAKKKE